MIPQLPALSVIIVNWNTREQLLNCLKSHFEAVAQVNQPVEMIVIDNGSTDGSVEALRKTYAQSENFLLLQNNGNIGFATACNQGLEKATGENLLLLNPDTLLKPDTYAKVLSFLPTAKAIGVVGIKTYNPDGSLQPSVWPRPGLFRMFLEGSYLYLLLPKRLRGIVLLSGYYDYRQSREVGMVLGAFLWITRATYEKIGGLDASLFLFGEDLEYCLRAHQQALEVFYFSDANYIHLGNQATQQQPPLWRVRRTVAALYDVLSRYHGKNWLLLFCLLNLYSIFLRMVLATPRKWLRSLQDGRLQTDAGYVSHRPHDYFVEHGKIFGILCEKNYQERLKALGAAPMDG